MSTSHHSSSVWLLQLCFLVCICREILPEPYSKNVRKVLKKVDAISYLDENRDNVLHLAIRSEDPELIRLVENRFSELCYHVNREGQTPFELAVDQYSLASIRFLDSLQSNSGSKSHLSQNFQRLYCNAHVIAQARISRGWRIPMDIKQLDTSARNAEDIYVYLLDKLSEKYALSALGDPDHAFTSACNLYKRGYRRAFGAIVKQFEKDGFNLPGLLSNLPSRNYDSVSHSLLTHFSLPISMSSLLFTAIALKSFPLVKALVDSGIVINDHSVHDGKVKSALSFANEKELPEVVNLLKAHGASDAVWFELLVPGYWPGIGATFTGDRQWYTIRASGNSATIGHGPLDLQDLTVQRREYWSNKPARTLFMVATNKPGGISSFTTCIAGPKILAMHESLQVAMPSGLSYKISVAPGNAMGLVITSGKRTQKFCHRTYASPGRSDICIVWAGDIDDDNKLDLVVTPHPLDESNYAGPYLLALSTLAAREHLLG